jgi:hypothetical protein
MTPNKAQLGAPLSPTRRYVVRLDDSLSNALVDRDERHHTSPPLDAQQALALASAFTSIPVTTTGKWLLPAAGGQSVVSLELAP